MSKTLKIVFILSILAFFILLKLLWKNTPDPITCSFYAQHCSVEGFTVICGGGNTMVLTGENREKYIQCLIENKE